MTPEESGGSNDGTEIRVQLARFEAKLDVALAHHSAKLDEHARDLAAQRDEGKALEIRVRELEKTPTVTQKQLAVVAAGLVGVIGALSPLLERLYS